MSAAAHLLHDDASLRCVPPCAIPKRLPHSFASILTSAETADEQSHERAVRQPDPRAADAAPSSAMPGMRDAAPAPLLGGSPFPPIAEYGFLSDCETTALVAPERRDRVAVPAAHRLTERVRRAAGPRRRLVPARPVRRQRPRRAPLPAGHDGARDQLGHRLGLDHRARRAADRRLAPRGRPLRHAPPRPHRLRRRPRAAAHDPLRQRPGRDRHGLRAGVRLRHQAGALGVHRHRLPRRHGDRARAPTSGSACAPTCGSASRARAPPRATG